MEMKQNQIVKEIEGAVAMAFDVPLDILRNPDLRRFDVVRARQVARYLAVRFTFLSKKQIGDLLGCHRTSIIHSCGVLEEEMSRDDEMRSSIHALIDRLVPLLRDED
jgi:chromosomal replication initiation ATPase DnaA